MEVNKVNKPIIDIQTRVMGVFGDNEFNQLSPTEKRYAYHFSKASWEGCKICYFQNSWEAPALFYIFQHVFSNPISQLKKSVSILEFQSKIGTVSASIQLAFMLIQAIIETGETPNSYLIYLVIHFLKS